MPFSPDFKKLLVPVDLSEASRAVLRYALPLAKRTGASIDVLFVWEFPRFVSPDPSGTPLPWTLSDIETTATTQARQELEAVLRSVDSQGVALRALLEVGSAPSSILRVAEREHADLIVMGTHGRTGVERFFLGSVAQRVVASAPCPVLTLHPY